MKNIKILGISLLTIIHLANAQETENSYKKFRFGLAVQPNLSWMKVESKEFESNGISPKFSYGLLAEFAFAQNYGLATGIQILTTGGPVNYKIPVYFREDGNIDLISNSNFLLGRRNYGTQYLNVPLSLKMRTNEIGYMTYFAQFGLDAGFKTNAKSNDTGTSNAAVTLTPQTPANNRAKHNINNDVNFFRLALNIGAGAEYNLSGSTSFVFGINYSNGFVNVLKKTSSQIRVSDFNDPFGLGTNLNQNAKSHFIGLTLGVLF